jgi:hypothetical protein
MRSKTSIYPQFEVILWKTLEQHQGFIWRENSQGERGTTTKKHGNSSRFIICTPLKKSRLYGGSKNNALFELYRSE